MGQLDAGINPFDNSVMIKRPIRVALVDDDASVRKALARVLAASSFDIRTFASAAEFLASLKAGHPDCLLLDLHMPEFNGIELQHYLAKARISLPTIIITAHDEPGLRGRCKLAGAAAFLLKPLDRTALVNAINDLAGRT